jgi:DNA polymerase III delta subunit
LVVGQKTKEAYQEFSNLEKKGIEMISLFSGINTSFRNILNIKFQTNAKKSIFSNKLGMYKLVSDKLTEDDVKKIYSMLADYDLKFKRGEISEEMLVTYTMNYILNYGSNK